MTAPACVYAEFGVCRGEVHLYPHGHKCEEHAPPPPPMGDRPPVVLHGPDPSAVVEEVHPPLPPSYVGQSDHPPMERAERARDAKLDQVNAHATEEWKEAARRALWAVACRLREFTVDDVWAELEAKGVPSPAEPRALGPILMRAIRAGAIRDTGRMGRSARRHASKVTLYERTPK